MKWSPKTQSNDNKDTKEWTDSEILALLNAIELHPHDWDQVCKIIGRNTLDCIQQFIQIDTHLNEADDHVFEYFKTFENPSMQFMSYLQFINGGIAAASAREMMNLVADLDDQDEFIVDHEAMIKVAVNAAVQESKLLADDEDDRIGRHLRAGIDTLLWSCDEKLKVIEALNATVQSKT